jgi:hypothetical protein
MTFEKEMYFIYINIYGLTADEYCDLVEKYLKPKFYFLYDEEKEQEEDIELVIEKFFETLEEKWKGY